MINKNFLKTKLFSRQEVIGTWVTIPSVVSLDIICSSGLDFVIIDMEHGPISFETAQEMVITAESRGVSPVIRVGGISEHDILRALDIGAHAVQIPNVNSTIDLQKIVTFSKYPPIGNRGFSPFVRAANYSLENSTKITKIANENTLVAVNLEGLSAFQNIDEILEIDCIDIFFIGLFDLSKSLGKPGETNNIKVQKLFTDCIDKIHSKSKFIGTISTNIEDIERYRKLGVNYIVHLVDSEMLKSSYQNILSRL